MVAGLLCGRSQRGGLLYSALAVFDQTLSRTRRRSRAVPKESGFSTISTSESLRQQVLCHVPDGLDSSSLRISSPKNKNNEFKDYRRLRREMSRAMFQVRPYDYPKTYSPGDIIKKKRVGRSLSTDEILWIVQGFHRGVVQDYQMSSFLMAICCKGMSNREAIDLTEAMVNTGTPADLSSIRPGVPKVDKQSTGGVGDKISLILTPLASKLGLIVPMMSGRGLGHTGGTLDKLRAIPGLNTKLDSKDYLRQLESVGCAIVAPPQDYAPVEQAISALRDVSGSVEDVSLVASSIMSKKLSEKPNGLLLDVKMGKGAFFKSLNDAAALASTMVAIGEDAGIATCSIISNMDRPLGGAVGNWVEVREAVTVLRSKGEYDRSVCDSTLSVPIEALLELEELALAQAAIMLGLGGLADSYQEAYQLAKQALYSGECVEKLASMVEAQGGDPAYVYDAEQVPLSNMRRTFFAKSSGVVQDINAFEIGMASIKLGAGRQYADEEIDHQAGILLHKRAGDCVAIGEPIFTAFVGDVPCLNDPMERLDEGYHRAMGAFEIVPDSEDVFIGDTKIIEYFVDASGLQPFETIKSL